MISYNAIFTIQINSDKNSSENPILLYAEWILQLFSECKRDVVNIFELSNKQTDGHRRRTDKLKYNLA